MIALDLRLSTAFTAGLLAAINPCGFVLLPTYLLYFLGMENLRPGAERASIPRALKVSLAVSAGFMTVFLIIGTLTRLTSNWFIRDQAPWLSLFIGVAMVILGIAMLFGYRVPLTTPKLDVNRRDRTVVSMYLFGLAYAVASLGCTIGPFLGTVLGGFTADGFATGVSAVVLYGLGMAVVVTGLTVTLALANTALLGVLRRGMSWFEYLAGAFVLLTGLYLCWYWFNSIRDNANDQLIGQAESWQSRLSNTVIAHQTTVVVVLVSAIVVAVLTSLVLRRAESE